jgi:hypothetical protein
MSRVINESDWRLFRKLEPIALDHPGGSVYPAGTRAGRQKLVWSLMKSPIQQLFRVASATPTHASPFVRAALIPKQERPAWLSTSAFSAGRVAERIAPA